jgi:hypothetical protein
MKIILDNKKINFLFEGNFIIFELDNFLDDINYDLIYNNFPSIPSLKFEKFELEKNNKKFFINSREKIYEKIIKENIILNNFHNAIFSKKFFDFFYNNLKNKIILSRLYDYKFLFKLFKPIKLNNEKKIFDKFYTNIKTQIEFSYMFNQGKIVPHTDSRHKMLSLLIFFPEKNEDMILQEKFGTTFWSSPLKNINNEHLVGEKEIEFKKNSKILFQIPFIQKKLFGFIGNENSWHSVETFNLNKKYIRKSININFYF